MIEDVTMKEHDKRLLEVITCAKKNRMEVVFLYTPDYPGETGEDINMARIEKRFGVYCFNNKSIIPKVDLPDSLEEKK